MTERSIFIEALDRPPGAERTAFLDAACGPDVALRQRVEALLASHEAGGDFLEKPAPHRVAEVLQAQGPPGAGEETTAESRGSAIGPYQLLQRIGEGGMGTVWMAQQTEPVKRLVALKLIKPGMDSQQVLARFEAERQALARMEHPHIARVLDAGASSDGGPYFVMELVRGVPITRYCDEHRLTLRQRLELFVPVCQAVQHAHQKGIIHRDLKPSNVLVARYDGQPVVKVIDFGVAKAMDRSLTDATPHTGFGAVVGTLEYMSPEQASFNALDVDTRSDVYSLGVLLYELLTGSPPFARHELELAGLLEALRVIREQEPARPSTKLSTADGLPALAANRATEPRRLGALVRGELDWIVMRALEKDRNRRYDTANAFALDIQRYLANEPVLAGPPSARYRLRKFVRRNRVVLAVAGLVLFFLVLLGGGLAWVLGERAVRQARVSARLDLHLGEVEQLEKEQKWPEALAEARRARALADEHGDAVAQERVRPMLALLELVAKLDEIHQQPVALATKVGIDPAATARRYEEAFRDYGVNVLELPVQEAVARLRARPAAAVVLAAALDSWTTIVRGQSPEQAQRLLALAGEVDPDSWRVQVRQATASVDIATLNRLASSPDTARQPLQSQMLLAQSLAYVQPVRDEALLERACALLERAATQYPDDFWVHYDLACLFCERQPRQLESAVRHLTAARALRRHSAPTWHNLGLALQQQGKRDEALVCYQKAVELDDRYAWFHNALGILLMEKKLDEAIACFEKATALDPGWSAPHHNLGLALERQDKLEEAIARYRKAINLDQRSPLPLVEPHARLGDIRRDQGKVDEAIAHYARAAELGSKEAEVHTELGMLLAKKGQLEKAIACHQRALALNPSYILAHANLGAVAMAQGRVEEAIAYYQKAMALDQKSPLPHAGLGLVRHRQGKVDEALAHYSRAVELGSKDPQAHHNLGVLLANNGQRDRAIACYQKAIELDPGYTLAHNNLAVIHHSQGRFEEAIACYRRAVALEPNNPTYHADLAGPLLDGGWPDEAIASCRTALRLDPNHAAAYRRLGRALVLKGQPEEAIAPLRKAVEREPESPMNRLALALGLRSAAWRLSTGPDRKPADGARALGLAREAVQLTPGEPNAWAALGAAQYRAGDWQAAIAALEKGAELRKNSTSAEELFTAMAHWQLGNQPMSRLCYDQAVQHMDRQMPNYEELRRLRTEAAALLKIEEGTKPK